METMHLEKHAGRLSKGLLTWILTVAWCSSLCLAGSTGLKKPNIKGLYIGMTLHDAKGVAEKFTDMTNYKLNPFKLSQYKFREFQCDGHKYWFSDVRQSVVSPIVFATDAEKKVTFISIHGALVDKLYNSADYTARQFVQKFAHMNDIPQMAEITSRLESPLPNILPDSGWTYSSADGYRVTVFTNKDIDMEKTGGKQCQTLFKNQQAGLCCHAKSVNGLLAQRKWVMPYPS